MTAAPVSALRIRHHRGARRMTLRVPGDGGPPVLTLPPGTPEAAIGRFLAAHRDWLADRLAARDPGIPVGPGIHLPVEGRPRRIALAAGGRVVLGPDRLDLPGPPGRMGPQAAGWLRALARDRAAPILRACSDRLGVAAPTALVLGDPRTRWGSCSCRGRIMLSWRLVMAPPGILAHVAAHEAAHLVEMTHGPRFWRLLAWLDPDHRAARAWLKTEGPGLHRYRFQAVADPA